MAIVRAVKSREAFCSSIATLAHSSLYLSRAKAVATDSGPSSFTIEVSSWMAIIECHRIGSVLFANSDYEGTDNLTAFERESVDE